ncbi:hypothetical protein [Candidatus Bandiella euplotis]|uniref:hypothetical protein n=1 Tax=Candidatus Bandiella euplotis TaxID=1664265 RepID=UPI0038995B31
MSEDEISELKSLELEIIIKVPPSKNHISIIEHYQRCGVKYFHLFNSFPTKNGGASGEVIREHYLRLVKRVNRVFGDSIQIIGGGGIQSVADILAYSEAGAEFFSVSTLFFHPLKLIKFIKDYKNENIKLQ